MLQKQIGNSYGNKGTNKGM
uniref:Uncharacterized protein n=1 Tax=Rhizophora mucronata TaxID=61149 RepID=A0A2P2JJI1_RHIMU